MTPDKLVMITNQIACTRDHLVKCWALVMRKDIRTYLARRRRWAFQG